MTNEFNLQDKYKNRKEEYKNLLNEKEEKKSQRK